MKTFKDYFPEYLLIGKKETVKNYKKVIPGEDAKDEGCDYKKKKKKKGWQ